MLIWIKANKSNVIIGSIAILIIMYLILFNRQVEVVTSEAGTSMEEIVQQDIETNQGEENSAIIMVDLKGAVNHPGVYEVESGDRVNDLINIAGGILPNADQKNVNLALKLVDEMVIYIPLKGEVLEEGISTSANPNSSEGSKVNINTANETELQTISGIGPSKSLAIIEYREANGAFKSIEDLKSVSGIGDKTFEKLKGDIDIK